VATEQSNRQCEARDSVMCPAAGPGRYASDCRRQRGNRLPSAGKRARATGLRPSLAALPLVIVLAVGAPVPKTDAAETYYRWKDERGKLVVSDRPPTDPEIEYEVVSQRTSLVRRVPRGEGAVPAEVTPRPGNRFEQVDTDEAEVEKNPEACARARTNLETLNTSARIRIRDPDTGEMRYLTEEEKLTQRERAEETIRVHCE